MLEEDYLQTSFWDTDQSLPSNGINTAVKFSENEQQKDGFQDCKCGKEMSDCSIHPNTSEKWIAYMRDSLVKILAIPEIKQELELKLEVVCTVKPYASLALLDRDTCSLRTSQQSLVMDSEQLSVILPRSGMIQNGYVYELPIVGRIIIETDGGYWPTPTAHNAKEGAYPSEYTRNTPTLASVIGGKINHQFTEWMMGWPIGWTDLKQSVMGKFHSKQQ